MALITTTAQAAGVSPYLPLSMNPAVERQIERAMVLAGQPIMRRPIAAATVLAALPRVCQVDMQLCAEVRSYLQPYMQASGITQLRITGNVATGDTEQVVPNAHGRSVDSNWNVVASGYYQPSDYLLLNAGALAYQGEAMPTGTFLSAGFDFAQLDVGYRDHWFSPMIDSSILISTEAPTMPSVTLSNSVPISPLGLSYEVFLARMSDQQGIRYFDTTTSGHPSLSGLQLSAEPVTGYAVSINRLMQYGGGARGGVSLSQFVDALTVNSNRPDVIGTSQEFGNQVASLASSMIFPGTIPFAVRMEFAGEDNSYAGHYRLGDSALMLGIDLPVLTERFDATYEYSEWQNVWYTHHIYPDGLTNEGYVLGHWFGDQRERGDPVTGSSHLLRVGMKANSGAYWQATYRTAGFGYPLGASTLPPDQKYHRLQQVNLQYSTDWHGRGIDAEVYGGRGALLGGYGGVSASISLAGVSYHPIASSYVAKDVTDVDRQFFLDAGVNNSHLRDIVSPDAHFNWTNDALGYHFGAGVRRPVTENSDLGARIELDDIHDRTIVSLRALDYRYRMSKHLALSGFFGVGRMHEGATALGYYWGGGLQWRQLLPGWDIGADLRVHDKLTRNRILSTDPPDTSGIQPRLHTDITGISFYLSRIY